MKKTKPSKTESLNLKKQISLLEHSIIKKALKLTKNNRSQAAKIMGISTVTMINKIGTKQNPPKESKVLAGVLKKKKKVISSKTLRG